jgi:tRNA (guanine-N7-)-methyltransferase
MSAHPHVRTFHPRRTRLGPTAAAAMTRRWADLGLDMAMSPLDLDAVFERRPVVLEIGFGMGETTLAMAEARPDFGILAIDVHTPGVGALIRGLDESGMSNVRVACGDAVDLLQDMILPASLSGIRIYFPDPWPKARHHKRRIIRPDLVHLMATRLRAGAAIHCATDWAEYAVVMKDVLEAEPLLRTGADTEVLQPRSSTRFERLGRDRGHAIVDLVHVRTSDAA